MKWSAQQDETLLFHFRTGARYSDIGLLLKKSPGCIGERLRRLGCRENEALLKERLDNGGSRNLINGKRAHAERTGQASGLFESPWQLLGAEDKFRALFKTNMGFRAIAREMSLTFNVLFSRSACLGKAHRLGLSRVKSEKKTKHFILPQRRQSPRGPGELIAFKAAQKRVSFDEPTPSTAIGLLELTETTCRWPYGTESIKFCGKLGADMWNKRPYCPEHHARSVGWLCAAE